MKKILFCLLGAMTVLASCSDDKNESTNNEPVGTYDFYGNTSVTYNGETQVSENVNVTVTFVENTDSVNVLFNKIKFVKEMPYAMDVVVPDVPYSRNGNVLSLSADRIVPTLASGDPVERFTATDIEGTLDLKNGIFEIALSFGSFPTIYLGMTK